MSADTSDDQKTDEILFDDLPSLFATELSKNAKIITIKPWQRLSTLMKRAGKELRIKSAVVLRGFEDQIEKCIACSEMVKTWVAEKPVFKNSNCTVVYQWNKIGEFKVRPENKLALEKHIPVLEILLSSEPFQQDQLNDSMQESRSVKVSSEKFVRKEDLLKFPELKRKQVEPIGAENPENIWRKKRKQ